MSGRWVTCVAVTACAVLTSACDVAIDAEGFTTRDERRFRVTGTPEITLATFDGAIEVRSWDRPDVEVVIERRAQTREEAETIAIAAEQKGNRISVEARRPGQGERRIGLGFHIGRSARIIASVPRAASLLARSGDGSIRAERIEGRVELRTSDGSVTADDLTGQVRVHSGDGNVKLSNANGTVDLDTGDGSVTVDGRFDSLRARTGDGRISVRAAAGSAMRGEWDLSTRDGSVELELPNGFNADLDAHTADGSVDVSSLAAASKNDHRRGTFRGAIGSGGATLRVRSGDGAIRVRGALQAEKTESPR